ncbi:ATP-binding protein [Sphingobium sufflavum]|uniref:ATP-binding protein n=1 Tax=Sphingobium sufflavum TaxID=1129547 RepID=UPI001F2A402C|nr:ATP-binding protein [Sphingobium sufflavum]MCE7798246.1 ATP-binding protein [Sphingobium sufflavum]
MKPGARRAAMLARLRSRQLAAWAAALLLAIGAVQVAASLLFYAAIDRQTLREDHARRVAELMVVGDRVHRLDPGGIGKVMTTGHLEVRLSATPAVSAPAKASAIVEIRQSILVWEPSLAARTFYLNMERGSPGRHDLVGSMQLERGQWLNFRSRDITSSWPIALRATAMTLLITLLCIGAGVIGLRFLTTPLRALSDAADAIGQGRTVAMAESGPADLRTLARSMNDMQARITGLVSDQAKSFEAISHDLRTPLTRLKIAADFVSDSDIARLVASSADEMEALLLSLQNYLRAQHLTARPEEVDLTAAVRGLLAEFEGETHLTAPGAAIARTWREPLMLALRALVDNALHYGTRARVAIERAPAGVEADWQVVIADDGPGIAEAFFGTILDPFVRLDEERARDTDGFGLGIPTAHRLLQRFGGALSFANAGPEGGLVVRVTVPRAVVG